MHFVRAKKPAMGLDMSPIIDCILQLLIFFMLTSSFSGATMKLTLPKAAVADQPQPDEVVVSVNAAGEVFVGPERIDLESLTAHLKREVAAHPDRAVTFRGDETIPYRRFVEVVDRVRRAGVSRFRIAHTPLAEVKP